MNKKLNKYVVVRSVSSGVHAGYLVSSKGDLAGTSTVTLKDARRLWRWPVKKMTGELSSLSEVAVYGIDSSNSLARIGVVVPDMMVLGVCEILTASRESQRTIQDA